MIILYEWRKKTRRTGKPTLDFKCPTTSDDYNFRSVYGYPQETVDFINKNNNTRNLKGKPVYSDELLIDIDNPENITEVEKKLFKLRISYDVYVTGNRGMHYHVPILPMVGTGVVYSQVQFLKNIGIYDLIDNSIYKEGGQFRAVHAVHGKTGKRKYKIGSVAGTTLEIPTLVPPPISVVTYSEEGTEEDMQSYINNLLAKRDVGGRHMHMFIIWKSGLKAGIDPDTIKNNIRWWNSNQNTPHDNVILEKKLESFR